jgi:hypothetical protein
MINTLWRVMNESEYIREVEKNPLLAFTLLNIIDKFYSNRYIDRKIFDRFPDLKLNFPKQDYILTPSRFYRIAFLLYKDLKRKGLDLKLPYYWYKSGPIIYLKNVPKIFKVQRLNKTQQVVARYEKWKDIILLFEGCESCFSDAIIVTLGSDKLSKYTRLDIIYEYSPSELHKFLITLLNEINKVSKLGQIPEKSKKNIIDVLKKLNVALISNKYPNLKPAFLKTIDIIDNELKKANIEFVHCLLEKLWDVFSLGLRARENENIDKQTLCEWNLEYEKALNDFYSVLSRYKP